MHVKVTSAHCRCSVEGNFSLFHRWESEAGSVKATCPRSSSSVLVDRFKEHHLGETKS